MVPPVPPMLECIKDPYRLFLVFFYNVSEKPISSRIDFYTEIKTFVSFSICNFAIYLGIM